MGTVEMLEFNRKSNEQLQSVAQKREELALTRLQHAVSFLNNHITRFGWRDRIEADEQWKGDPTERPDGIDILPDSVRDPMIRACARAAEFVEMEFARSLREGRSTERHEKG